MVLSLAVGRAVDWGDASETEVSWVDCELRVTALT